MGFIAQCYEEKNGQMILSGNFESGMVDDIMPAVGDTILIPITKKRDDPRFTERDVFKILQRFFEVDPSGGPAIVRLVVSRAPTPIFDRS